MKKATLIKDVSKNFSGRACVYELNPPIVVEPLYKGDFGGKVRYVVISTSSTFGLETYIFPSTKTGKIRNWGELAGSMKGTSSHSEVLERAGYAIQA